MAQGSVNMPGYRPATIGAITQALDAVQKFYGLQTQDLKQKLIESQANAGIAESNAKTKAANYQSSLWDSINPPTKSEAADDSSDNSDSHPPLLSAMNAAQKTPMQAVQDRIASGQPVPAELLAQQEALQKYKNTGLEGQKLQSDVAFAPEKQKLESQKPVQEAIDKFNTAAKEPLDSYNAGAKITKFLQDKNPQSDASAVATLTKSLGARVNEDTMDEIGGNKGYMAGLINKMSQKGHGLLSDEERMGVAKAANTLQNSAYSDLQGLAGIHAGQQADVVGVPPAQLAQKLLKGVSAPGPVPSFKDQTPPDSKNGSLDIVKTLLDEKKRRAAAKQPNKNASNP